MKKLRVAVVGCGKISKKHFIAINKNSKFLKLVAACDIDKKVLFEINKKYKIKTYENFTKMINLEKLDLLSVCTPSGYHAKHTIEAAKRKINVLTEKPMATKLEDGLKMLKACKQNKRKLFVVQQTRLNKTLILLKKAIDEKRFGKIALVQVNVFYSRPQNYYNQAYWRGTKKLDGGTFMNQASHYVDLLKWLIGPIEKIQAITDTILRKIEVEDTGVLNLKWKNGALGSMSVTTLAYPKNYEGSITIIGEKGIVKIGGLAANKIKIEHWKFKNKKKYDKLVKKINSNKKKFEGHTIFYRKIIDSLKNKKIDIPDGNSAIETLKILVAIYKSANRRRSIILK